MLEIRITIVITRCDTLKNEPPLQLRHWRSYYRGAQAPQNF